ncbi:MAG: antitermination protein NusG [Phycisphaerae bacterium]|nr:antitermination protein NusG [Phycisphaerae bacterium]
MTLTKNPPIIFPPDTDLTQIEGVWWVAHTKPRQEKALATDMLRGGMSYFAPMYETTKRSKGRSWKSILMLFPGYVFLCGGETERLFALQTNRIANIIEVPDQQTFVEQLSQIQQLLESGLAVTARQSLKTGTICRIRSGALGGMEGRIERSKGKTRFVVNVSILGQAAMVEIDADQLEPIT